MNDHLIKRHRKSIIINCFGAVLFLIYIFFILDFTSLFLIAPVAIFIAYDLLKEKQILLEITRNENSFILKSYSIFNGKKELKISFDNFIELEFGVGALVLWYKDDYGKTNNKYHFNAKPFNEIYSQVRAFKIDIQELHQK